MRLSLFNQSCAAISFLITSLLNNQSWLHSTQSEYMELANQKSAIWTNRTIWILNFYFHTSGLIRDQGGKLLPV